MHIYTSPTLSGIHRVESWPIAFSTYILHQLVSAGSLCASAMCVCARERLGVLASCFNGAKEVCHGCVCKRCCQPKYFALHAPSGAAHTDRTHDMMLAAPECVNICTKHIAPLLNCMVPAFIDDWWLRLLRPTYLGLQMGEKRIANLKSDGCIC